MGRAGWGQRPHLRALAASFVLALTALGCNGGPTGPNAPAEGPLRIHPVLQTAVEPGELELDAIGITIIEIDDGSMVSDTVLAYTGDPETVFGWILDLETLPTRVRVAAEAWSGETRMFAGTLETDVEDASPSAPSVVHDLEMVFVGPGAGAVEIEVTPVEPLLTFGDTLRFQVTGRDADGDPVDDVVAIWSSSDPDLAPISLDALLEAPHQRGSVRVEARTPGGLSDETGVGFQPSTAELVVVRGDGASAPVGSSVPLEVRVVGEDGEGVAGVSVTFTAEEGSSVTDAVVESDGAGSAETTGVLGPVAGDYTFTASAPDLASVSMVVTAEPGPAAPGSATITASPTSVEADGVAASTVTVELFDAHGNAVTESGGTVVLSTTLGTLTDVTDNQDGTYTANLSSAEVGTATVTGTLEGEAIDDSATVTFTDPDGPTEPVIASIVVTPSTATLTALGDTQAFTAEAFDANGQTVSGVTFTWSVADESVASIDAATGVATALANGSTSVTATADGVSGSATLTVEQAVASVVVSPSSATLTALGDTQPFTAEALDANGQTVSGVSFTWSVADESVASIDAATGVATALANGSTSVTATADGVSGSATLTVEQAVASVVVSPSSATLTALGDTQAFTAEALDANGQTVSGVTFTWSVADESVASIDAATGVATAVDNGSTSVTATADGVSSSATLTVEQAVHTVTVDPTKFLLSVSDDTSKSQQQLTAEAYDANGNLIADASFTWESLDVSIVTVDSTGLVSAVASGTTQIRVTSDGVTAESTATVQ